MMPTRDRMTGRLSQRGAALIVSLILLMVLTVLAISTMRTASLDLVMAGNTQYRQNAFHLAQTGIDAALRAPEPAGAAACGAEVSEPAVEIEALGGRYVPSVCFRGECPLCVEGTSVGPNYLYEAAAEGTTDQRGARVRLVQGLLFPAARGAGGT